MVLMKRWSIIRCRMSALLLLTIYNGQQNIYKSILVFNIYILKPKSWLIEASSRPVQNSYVCKLWYTEREKISHFDIKSWVTCGTKIRPGKVGNWRIFESNWLNIKNPIDPNILKLLTYNSPSDSTFNVKMTFFSRCTESVNWVIYPKKVKSNFNSASDSTFRVKMTQFFLSVHWQRKLSHFTLKKLSQILIPPVTQLLGSKWLNYFSRCTERKIQSLWPKKMGQILIPPVTQLLGSKLMTQFFFLVH